jgi:hypothetical protein
MFSVLLHKEILRLKDAFHNEICQTNLWLMKSEVLTRVQISLLVISAVRPCKLVVRYACNV